MSQIDSNQTTKITLIKTHIQKAMFQSLSVEAKQKTAILRVLFYIEETMKALTNFGEQLKNLFNIKLNLQGI